MLRFSANLSLLFTEVDLIDRFKAAHEKGFSAVEIQFPYLLSAEQIQQQLQKYDLKLVLFNVAADNLLQGGEGLAAVPEKQPQFRQAVEQALGCAEILKPDVINILPGCCQDKKRTQEYLETFKNNLLYACNAFSAVGINTLFEAVNIHDMPGFIIHNGQQMLEILDELHHPHLLMQYDIYHMHKMQEDCAGFLSQHLDKIGHIQFADCPGRGQPGSGQIDFAPLFKMIADSPYNGWTGAEYKPTGLTGESLDWLNSDSQQKPLNP